MKATFILGAGASKNANMPLVRDFSSPEYFRILTKGWEDAGYKEIPRYEQAIDLCARIQKSGLNFEEYLARCYYEDEKQYAQLIDFYQKTLAAGETYAGMFTNPKTGYIYAFYYLSFAWLLQNHFQKPTVISFNHDLFFEISCQWDHFHYGSMSDISTGIGGVVIDVSKDKVFFNKNNNIELLKLHGSFNFLFCRNCNGILVGQDYNWHMQDYFQCTECGGPTHAYYVPPLKQKNVTKYEMIWQDAATALQQTEILFVIGYSMPAYDEAAQELLKKHLNPDAVVVILDKFASSTVNNYAFLNNTEVLYADLEFEAALDIWTEGNLVNHLQKRL